MSVLRAIDISKTNNFLHKKTVQERIWWLWKNFGDKFVLTCSGGQTSQILPHLTKTTLINKGVNYNFPIIFVDTGYYNDSTLRVVDNLQKNGYNLKIYRSKKTKKEIEEKYPNWQNKKILFNKVISIIKYKPLNKALEKLDASIWVSGLSKSKIKKRKKIKILEKKNGIYHFHPIYNWNQQRIQKYLKKHNLPSNDTYYDICKGVDQNKECGIHQKCGRFDQ